MKLTNAVNMGIKSAVWTGGLETGDITKLLESPRTTLADAGVELPADSTLSVRMERAQSASDKTLQEAGGEVIIIILDDGTVIIIVVAM